STSVQEITGPTMLW
nr:immunoglobulin heavy chain junction region [Mus musculus]